MRFSVFVVAALMAAPAIADPGHLGLSNGHDHWLAAAAVAAAIAAAIWGALKGKRDDEQAEPASEDAAQEPQEA